MQLYFYTVLFALSALTVSPQQLTDTCIVLDRFGCDICYKESPLQFTNCTLKNCDRVSGSGCFQYSFVNQQQSTCLNRCCGETFPRDQTISFNIQNIQKCREAGEVIFDNTATIIILSVIVGACLICCCLTVIRACMLRYGQNQNGCCDRLMNTRLCLRLRGRRRGQGRERQQGEQGPQRPQGSGQIIGSSHRRNINQMDQNPVSADRLRSQNEILWEQQQSDNNSTGSVERTCTICLEGGSNITTHCKHNFHLNCIHQWSRFKEQCPNCHSTEIQPMKLYCMRCQQRYVYIDLRAWSSWQQLQNRLRGSSCPFCRQN